MFDVRRVREDFPILKNGFIYLDSAASSLTPEQVLQAELDYYRNFRANIHRGLYKPSIQASEAFDDAREKLARFINASKDEIVFTKSTTEGINLVANALDWKQGDSVETTLFEHHSNLLPWLRLSKRGVKVNIREDYSSFSKSSKLIAVGHASNVLGSVAPVERIAREKGDSLLLVDAAQSAPHFSLDVKKLGCDFLVFSAHKMLGPTGIGVLYIKRDAQKTVNSPFLGGGTIRAVTAEDYELTHFPESWEAGTPNIAGAIGFGAAVDYLKKLGMGNVHAHSKKLAEKAAKELREINCVTVYGEKEFNGIVSFNVKSMPAHDVAAMLDESARICVRSGHHCAMPLMKKLGCNGTARASFYVYNTEEEVEKLASAVKDVVQLA
ncbi:cysteine desulfurase [Candidatus Micrarchaeota archaeon]|nr:cysteine desulfurase [Candidatus Micrarchaeota archaeon]